MLKKIYIRNEKLMERKNKYPFMTFILSIGGLIFFVFVIKTSILDANNIPSSSMEPTLMIGDFLFVNKMRYTLDVPFTNIHIVRLSYPQRGDIVTFTPPQYEKNLQGKTLVKRVVAVPGDTVEVVENEIRISGTSYPVRLTEDKKLIASLGEDTRNEEMISHHKLYVEKIIHPFTGEVVVEHYMMKIPNESQPTMHTPGRIWKIPPGKFLMMGDNRDNSEDCRACSMVEQPDNTLCRQYNECQSRNRSSLAGKNECTDLLNEKSPTWGLIDADKIHGKVYLAYFSVDWGTGAKKQDNPIFNIGHTLIGDYKGVSIRWNRIFKRIY